LEAQANAALKVSRHIRHIQLEVELKNVPPYGLDPLFADLATIESIFLVVHLEKGGPLCDWARVSRVPLLSHSRHPAWHQKQGAGTRFLYPAACEPGRLLEIRFQ